MERAGAEARDGENEERPSTLFRSLIGGLVLTLRPRSTPVLVRDGVGRLIRLGRGDTRDILHHLMMYAISVVRTTSLSSSVALISHW